MDGLEVLLGIPGLLIMRTKSTMGYLQAVATQGCLIHDSGQVQSFQNRECSAGPVGPVEQEA